MEDDVNTAEDWIYNSKRELKFIDDGDLISSDSSDEVNNSECPKKYNQLNPRANLIYKLLKPIRPKVVNVWKAVTDSHCTDLLNSHISLNTMAKIKKSNKRKYEEMKTHDISSEEGMTERQKKKAKQSSDGLVDKKVNRKGHNHSLSSSDGEGSAEKFRNKHKDKKKDGVKVTVPSTSNLLSSEKCNHNHQLTSSDGESSPEKPKHKRGNKNLHVVKVPSTTSHLLSSENDSATEYISRSNLSSSTNVSENDIRVNGQSFQGNDSLESNEDSGIDHHKINNNSKEFRHNSHSNPLDKDKIKGKDPKSSQEGKKNDSKFSFLLSDDLIEKNNIWLLQCPRNMDCTMMINQYINLNGSCELEDGNSTFEAHSFGYDQKRAVTLAVPIEHNHLQLCTIPISGNIYVEESVKMKSNNSYNLSEPLECVELEKDLQARHPLLGTNYESQPRSIERAPQSPKKRKKKKHSKHKDVEEFVEQEVSSSSIGTTRKRKRKESLQDSVIFDSQSFVEESHELEESHEQKNVKRKKRKKHHSEESLL